MVFEYTITDDQFHSLLKYSQRNSPATAKTMKGGVLQMCAIITAFFLLLIILSWLNWDGTGLNPLWQIVGLAFFALFSIAIYPLFIKFSNATLLKQSKKHGFYDGLTGERRLLTVEDGLRVETEISIFELRFTAINKIILMDGSLFLWHNQNVYLIVPLAAFPSPNQRSEFLNLLREKTQSVFLQVGKNFVERPLDLGAALAIEDKSVQA